MMAQPTPYNKNYDFNNQSFDDSLLNKLDEEFDDIETCVDEVCFNLALIQRDDGALRNGIVTLDALGQDLSDEIIRQVEDDAQASIVDAQQYATDAQDAATSAQSFATAAGVSAADAQYWAGQAQAIGSAEATAITYDNAVSGLAATNCQTAIDELDSKLDGLASDEVSYDNAVSGLSATDVKAALDELKALVAAVSVIPSGVIAIWKGSLISIPSGWVLCNGSNGTPDLRDKFVVGAAGTYSVSGTGGSATVTLTTDQIPAHNHVASSNSTGAHTHDINGYPTGGAQGLVIASGADTGGGINVVTTQSGGIHSHAITINNTGGGTAHTNLPPYYALAYIMKT